MKNRIGILKTKIKKIVIDARYPFNRCQNCDMKFFGIIKDKNGNIERELSCKENCFYTRYINEIK